MPVNAPARERSNPPSDIFLEIIIWLAVLAHVFVDIARNICLRKQEG